MDSHKFNLLKEIVRGIPELTLVVSESGEYLEIGGISEHNPDDVVGRSLTELFPDKIASLFESALHKTFTSPNREVNTLEYQLFPSSDLKIAFPYEEARTFQLKINPLPTKYKGERIAVCICTDITELRNYEQSLLKMAEHDPLTQVYNRNKLYEQLESSFKEHSRYKTPVSFILLDIDDLKSINDVYGHLAGDKAICHFAKLCSKAHRATDTFARLGGDEFGLVMPNINQYEAAKFAERIRKLLAKQPYFYDDQLIPVSASIGISEMTAFDQDVEKVILRADQAMYISKKTGKNRVILSNIPESLVTQQAV